MDDPYTNLRDAIITKSIVDAVDSYIKHGKLTDELRTFFESEYFFNLTGWESDEVLKQIRKKYIIEVLHSVQVVKDYCTRQEDCEKCMFLSRKDGTCKLDRLPYFYPDQTEKGG